MLLSDDVDWVDDDFLPIEDAEPSKLRECLTQIDRLIWAESHFQGDIEKGIILARDNIALSDRRKTLFNSKYASKRRMKDLTHLGARLEGILKEKA